jgi:hypothetical protein
MRAVLVLLAMVGLVGCGDDGVSTDLSADLHVADLSATDAHVACGTQTCGANQVCVQPCCGGALPLCEPPTDGGGCAPPATMGQCFDNGLKTGCVVACTTASPFCKDVPSNCNPSSSLMAICSCYPSDPCAGNGSCAGMSASGVLSCVCA